MSEELLESGDEGLDPLEGAKKSGPGKGALAFMLLVGIGAGAWFGGPIVTPTIAAALAPSPEGEGGYEEVGEDGSSSSTGSYGDESEDDAGEPLVVSNLILNPANSGGSRFLVASLALDTTPDARTALEARDAETRDLLLTILSGRTVEELSNVALRDEIREDLRVTLNAMLGYDGVRRVFMPQFVIQ